VPVSQGGNQPGAQQDGPDPAALRQKEAREDDGRNKEDEVSRRILNKDVVYQEAESDEQGRSAITSPGRQVVQRSRDCEPAGRGRGSWHVGGVTFGIYRLFLIGFALAVTVALVLALEYTRFGAQVRAAVDNQRMARGLGINVDSAFAVTFALGSGLAGLGGALAIDIVGLDPSFALAYLVYVLIVVAVGGLGSIGGTFAAAMLLGISDMAGKYYFPAIGSFLIYLVMLSLLMWRPAGIFGRRT